MNRQYILCMSLLLLNGIVWAKNLGETCNPPATGATDECTVGNSECQTDKCACKTGFIKEGDKCLKDLEAACDNADECVSNAVCETNCKCKSGYDPVSGLCQKVLGSGCTSANAATVCSVPGSECQGTACTCKDGHKEENDVCKKVLGSECTSANAATVCSVDGSECQGTACTCKEGHKEENDVCKKTHGESCNSVDECVANAECNTECNCKEGYIDNDGKCSKESSANAVTLELSLILASLVILIEKHL